MPSGHETDWAYTIMASGCTRACQGNGNNTSIKRHFVDWRSIASTMGHKIFQELSPIIRIYQYGNQCRTTPAQRRQ